MTRPHHSRPLAGATTIMPQHQQLAAGSLTAQSCRVQHKNTPLAFVGNQLAGIGLRLCDDVLSYSLPDEGHCLGSSR